MLARAGIDEPPISLERIAESLGLPIRHVRLPGFFHGAIMNEDGLPFLMLNVTPPEEARRLALAHMLAHVVLVMADSTEGYPRGTVTEHIEADKLAREIVLPYRMVIEQAQLWFNDYRYVARLFAVDEDEMLARMRDVGVIRGPQGIMWDY